MAEQQKIYLKCPECGQHYRWKEHHAGEKVRCGQCRAKLRYPRRATDPMEVLEPSPEVDPESDSESAAATESGQADSTAAPAEADGQQADHDPDSGPGSASDRVASDNPSADEEADTYALAEDPDAVDASQQQGTSGNAPTGSPTAGAAGASPKPGGRCPQCNARVKSGAAVCVNCGYNFEQGRVIQTEVAADAEAQPEKPSKESSAESGESGSADDEPSLIEQQQNAEQPAAVTSYRAKQMREEARKERATAIYQEEQRKRAVLYPSICLAIAAVCQITANVVAVSSPAGLGAMTVGNLLALAAQAAVFVLIAGGLFVIALGFGMAPESVRGGLYQLFAATITPFAVANLIGQIAALPEALAAFNLMLWGLVVLLTTWGIVVSLFHLEYLDGAYVTLGILPIELAMWSFNEYAIPPMLNILA